jgi:hypothetical protein
MNLVGPQPLSGRGESKQDPKIDLKSLLGMTKRMVCTSKGLPFTLGTSYEIPCYGPINRWSLYAKKEEVHCIFMLPNYSWRNHLFS